MSEEFKMKTVKKGETDNWLSPPHVVEILVPYLKKFKTIWCPFDLESSAFVQVLREHGFNVIYSHIYTGQDFFEYEPEEDYDAIVSNYPFTKRNAIFERCYDLGKPFALLSNYAGLFDNRKRFDLFKDKGVELYIIRGRTAYTRESDGFSASPMFQSIYVCHDVLPKQIVFQDLTK